MIMYIIFYAIYYMSYPFFFIILWGSLYFLSIYPSAPYQGGGEGPGEFSTTK